MTSVTLTVNKANVFNEVAKTTSYTGAKKVSDGSMYDLIFTTDEDRLLLERFWSEAVNAVSDLLKPFIVTISSAAPSHGIDITANFTAALSLSGSYDTSLTDSIQSSLYSFFVNFIVSQWYRFADKEDSAEFAELAVSMLDDVRGKIYYKKKPTRVIPT